MKKIDKPLYVHLGQQLKAARLKKNYSLQDVADLVGKNKATIKRYEDATVRVDMDTLEKIANILDLQIMDVTTSFNGNEVEHNFGVYPRLDILLSNDKELQQANEFMNRFSNRFMERFIHLDVNLQKSILMMLNFNEDEINELMEFLH